VEKSGELFSSIFQSCSFVGYLRFKHFGHHQQLNDHHPMNFSGMVAHKFICRLEKVLNTPRSFSLKSLEKQAAGAISR
jgi:hypothetical protein